MRQLSKNFTQSDAEALGLKVGASDCVQKAGWTWTFS